MIVPFKRWHIKWLLEEGVPGFDATTAQALETADSWTVVVDGNPVACGGTLEQWPGRHVAWMYLNSKTGPHMLKITRAVNLALSKVKGRIELTVVEDFAAGHRWAKMLGFSVENAPGVLKHFGPSGENHVAYVRFNLE
jgi:hypothetical protein